MGDVPSGTFAASVSPGTLHISRVLAVAFRALGRRWMTLLIVTVVFSLLPQLVIGIFTVAKAPVPIAASERLLSTFHTYLQTAPFTLLFQPVFASLVACIVWADATRGPVGAVAAIRTVASRLFWILLVNLAVFGLVAIGLVAFVVPGVMAAMALYVALPVCALEGATLGDSCSRSLALTRGHRWKILALYLIGLVFRVTPVVIVVAVGGVVGFRLSHATDLVGTTIRAIMGSASQVLGGVLFASVYVELRGVGEGLVADDTAAIFA